MLILYQRNENEADCQIMYEKQSQSHNLLVQIKFNLTKIHHLFAANNATRKTAVEKQTRLNSWSDILTPGTRDLVPTLCHTLYAYH